MEVASLTRARAHAQLDTISIERLIDELLGRTWSPWAVLLTAFEDDPDDLPALDAYERLFTGEGAGTLNMVEFFKDMSHEKLDLSGSHVVAIPVRSTPDRRPTACSVFGARWWK